jgi:glycosyltransferase involved in cell wall biosynthesis
VFVAHGFKAALLRRVLRPLFRLAFNHPRQVVIFQNIADRDALVEFGAIRAEKGVLIRGSGVDLRAFVYQDERDGIPVVAFAARLLRDKGVLEFVQAARLLRARGVVARFWLIGAPDLGNPTSISEELLASWRSEGVVELLGQRSDIPSLFAQASVICLPSYREGLPKALVEAAAAGRAVVTTDVPGCRDAIDPGKTGLLVPIKDSERLADAIQILIEHPEKRAAMGRAGRRLAEREFSIQRIVDEHMTVYERLLK